MLSIVSHKQVTFVYVSLSQPFSCILVNMQHLNLEEFLKKLPLIQGQKLISP